MEILGFILLVPLSAITIISLLAALTLLLPVPVEKTRLVLESSLWRALLLGSVNFIFFAALASLFGWLAEQTIPVLNGVFILLIAMIVLGLTVLTLIGLAAFAQMLGDRIGVGKTPLTANLRGGALLLLAGLAPYIGWFLFTPLVLWTGLGAAISAMVRRRVKSSTTEDQPDDI